jgi:hypothetical protein
MYKILVTGTRSFIVGEKDVVKGGKRNVYTYAQGSTVTVTLEPSKSVYEVTDYCGKLLSEFSDINVIEKIKDKNIGGAPKVTGPDPLPIQAPGQSDELAKKLDLALQEIERLRQLVEKPAQVVKRK